MISYSAIGHCVQIGDLSRQLAEAQASHTAATADRAESLKDVVEADAKAVEQLAAFSRGETAGSPASIAARTPASTSLAARLSLTAALGMHARLQRGM